MTEMRIEMAEKEKAIEPEATAESKVRVKFDLTSLNTLAVVSIASAVSGIGALIAVITGHVSLAQIKRSGESGRALAIAGTVLGYLHLAGWIIFGILVVVASVLIDSGMIGLQPGGPEFMEFRKGFDGMHKMHNR
jgi:hypothetical protein